MKPLLSALSFQWALVVLATAGVLLGSGVLVWSKKRGHSRGVLAGTSIMVVPVVLSLLWKIEDVFIGVFGLDSVLGLGIMSLVFCLVAVAAAALISKISKRA